MMMSSQGGQLEAQFLSRAQAAKYESERRMVV